MVLAEILGTKDLVAILFVGIVSLLMLLLLGRVHVNVRGVSATVEKVADTVGEKNGNGPAMDMLAKALGQQAELLRGQERTEEFERRLTELSSYTHHGVHRLNGQVGQMWVQWAKDHGIDPADLPPPQPSPKEV